MQEKTRGGLFCRLSKTRENLSAGLSNPFRRDVRLGNALLQTLAEQEAEILQPVEQTLDTCAHHPCVTLMAGLNGAENTTTAKLVKRLKDSSP